MILNYQISQTTDIFLVNIEMYEKLKKHNLEERKRFFYLVPDII